MTRSAEQLRTDALAIWQAGVDAVRADRLVLEHVRVEGGELVIGDESLALSDMGRIVVVGAGKAGAGMAAGLEAALGEPLMRDKKLSGWINVPENCVRPLKHITLHGARPAGINEPTAAGVAGAERILELVRSLAKNDLCLCLISGGGSALLPSPVNGVTLADKLALTRFLSAAGANIQELNTVRKQLSQIKGGGLARACRAGRLISLIISDVLGDPLDVIASGPTVEDTSTAAEAIAILHRFGAADEGISPAAMKYLERVTKNPHPESHVGTCSVQNLILGNNAVAVDAAGQEAVRRGYSPAMIASSQLEGLADEVGRHLAEMSVSMRRQPGPDCLITGGEPIVKLVPSSERGLGGRNQQLILAALDQVVSQLTPTGEIPLEGIAMLSGGTDGEDGPTDAAGAFIDAPLAALMQSRALTPATFLARNNAYPFFESLGALLKTGPTHTNVCDVRVVVVDRP